MESKETIQLLKEIKVLLKELERFRDSPLLYRKTKNHPLNYECNLSDFLEVFEVQRLIFEIEAIITFSDIKL